MNPHSGTPGQARRPGDDSPPETARSLFRTLQPRLHAAGIEDPRRELMILLGHVTGEPIARLLARQDDPLAENTADALRQMAQRRIQREPLAYITGKADFSGLELAVGPGVLVPRPDSECLVEAAVAFVLQATGDRGEQAEPSSQNAPSLPSYTPDQPLRLLDTCTGSGAIGIAIARQLTDAGIPVALHLLDQSSEALAYARRNSARWCSDLPVTLELGDLFPEMPAVFDLITANPPYIPDGVLPGLMPEVSRHEPSEALAAGTDGLDVYRRIVACVCSFLRPGGWLMLEHGYDQAEAVAGLIRTGTCLGEPSLRIDYGGNPRVTLARRLCG